MEVSGDLEESVGKKVFAQANRLQQLHKTMRSYVVQDIDGEIGGIDYQIGARRADVEHQQRAATGQESAFKDRGAKVSLETAHFMHKVGSNLNGFAQRHSDAVNVGKVGLAAVSMLHPVSTAIFLGKYVFLSSPSVQTGMKNIFNSALEKVGTDSYTREYLSECAAEAAALHGSGISYAQLGKKIGGATRTTLNLAEKTVIRVKEVSPITFQYEVGRLNSGIPVDAVKLRNPFARNKHGIVDPTVKPHSSWKDSDILSVKDFKHPVPLTAMEKERVVDWMVYRKGLLDMWESKEVSFVNQDIKNSLRAVKNQLRDHMQPKDLAGILKENRGIEIHDHKGKIFSHIDEWNSVKISMENALNVMKNALHDTKSSVAEKELYQERISQISKMWDKYKKLTEEIDCQTKPKL